MTLKTAHPTPAENGVWRPAPAIRVSMLLHALAVMVLVIEPSWWLWIVGVLVGNHLVLTAAVMWPRGRMLGPNLTRLPASAAARGEVCLTFDDGPDPQVTPQVLELLKRHKATASFFCIGEKAVAFPALVTEIARCGHSVENHSYRHAHAFAFYSMTRLRREIAAAQTVIAGITGRPPVFFRAPLGFRSPLLDPVLTKFGLRYVSWTRRGYDAVRGNPVQVLRRLTRGLAAGDVLLLHDGAYARTDAGEPIVLAVLPALLDQLSALGLKSVSLPIACERAPAAQLH